MYVFPPFDSDQTGRFPITHGVVPDVTIVIPTFQRSGPLLHVLATTRDRLKSQYRVKLLVVDNNPEPQERENVVAFAKTTDLTVDYIHEPRSGVSNARNAALTFVDTRFLAFLDDDMEITPTWPDEMIKTSLVSGLGVIFGPIVAKFDNIADPRNPYLSPFYSRTLEHQPSVELKKPFGTGGCLIDLSKSQTPLPSFDSSLNESGGEDDIFFSALKQLGFRFGWAKDALCFENVPEGRISNRYILRRNLGYGQAPTRLAASKGVKGAGHILRHMLIGSLQSAVYGALYLGARLLNRPSAIRYLALTARGVGKVFWGNRFQQKLYGVSQLSTSS